MNFRNLFIILSLLIVSIALNSEANAQKSKKPIAKKTAVSAKGNLSIEAGVISRGGDVKPVARTEFYLLDQDLEKILSDAGYEPRKNSAIDSGAGLMGEKSNGNVGENNVQSFAVWNSYQSLYGEHLQKAQEAIKSHIIGTMTTDFSGKGEFSEVKAGNYFLMGLMRVGKQSIVWNMPITIKSGKQSVVLDNKNASEIF